VPVTAELIKSDVLEQLEHIASHRFEGASVDHAKHFIRALFEHTPPADLIERRPEHLYGAAIGFLRFAELRPLGEISLRVYTPNLDEHGWRSAHSIVEVITEDLPFLVDSISAELSRLGAEVDLMVHPVLSVTRDADGRLQDVKRAVEGTGTRNESFMQIHIKSQSGDRFAEIERCLRSVLRDVRIAVDDFPAMRAKAGEIAAQLASVQSDDSERTESVAFLEWLNTDHFTYLGYRYSTFEEVEGGLGPQARHEHGLGLLTNPTREVFERLPPPQAHELLRIFKANARSTVHRPVHLDALVIPDLSNGPSVGSQPPKGVHLFVGLFTLSAYSRSPERIPLLRHKIACTIERSGLLRGSHDFKALHYILETYPRDELFQSSIDNLLSISMGVLHLQGRQRVALFARRDPFDRFVSCLVYVPRDRFDTALRLRISELLATAFHGSVAAYYIHLGDQSLARLHLIVKTPGGMSAYFDHAALERRLLEATRSWDDRMKVALINELGETLGGARAAAFATSFPASYRERFDQLTAVEDVEFIERALCRGEPTMILYRAIGEDSSQFHLKLFSPHGFVPLSDVLPMLENMGLCVISEVPYQVRLQAGAVEVWLHDFAVATENTLPVDLDHVREDFEEVLGAVLRGTLENDGFNRLVLHAGLTATEVRWLRAYAKYLRQARVPFSLGYMQATLKGNPRIAKLLVDLFAAKFTPHAPGSAPLRPPHGRDSIEVDVLRNELLSRLDGVKSLDEDRILRRFFNAVDVTLRTNQFQTNPDGSAKGSVALKFDAQRLDHLPAPRPYREIFVFSSRVEGVHLRFGPVARGGLRWSDRLEDFRTEVLGLVKAQQVKNAVIVPVGSKGGFVVKKPPPASAGRDAFVKEGIECYRAFIAGLLDITDNRDGERIIPPEDVVCLDGQDPYLVVAADKGTATFSDIANEISTARGFWLGDAFASGGSAGYDHKKMGITARGAWESVKRHFREIGKDIQSEPFTVVGVGDMSGDVFGNGMLLSKQTRLVAAFNHLHVFVDPDPDPATSFAERKRLFELPRSSWADYDPAVISPGGGVFDRGAKSIQLSLRSREVLGIADATVTPGELVGHILRAPAELMFFGGIGTYVKAKSESDAAVGDRANDGLRIDASKLRCKVVGEGANLGMTQRARVEFALLGGRCNTDFIDNSAGVDCSDHEVNIKILLGEVERQQSINREQRDQLLQEMTDEVAALVLRDNYLQTQAVSVTQQVGARFTDRLARFTRELEHHAGLNRELEALPDAETLVDRMRTGAGLVRPELCVLISYAKNWLFQQLMATKVPDEPYLKRDLNDYFPSALRERFPEAIAGHLLRREIVATVVANDLINRAGITFLHEVGERTGASIETVTRAYVVAREVHGLRAFWRAVENLDNQIPAATQGAMLMDAGRLLLDATSAILRTHGTALDVAGQIERKQAGVRQLTEQLPALIDPEEASLLEQSTSSLLQAGVPEELARLTVSLPLCASACDVVALSDALGRTVIEVGRLYFSVGTRFGFEWLRRLARRLPAARAWDKQAIVAVVDELFISQHDLVRSMLSGCQGPVAGDELIERWIEANRTLVVRTQQLITELRATALPDFAMLAVANRQLKAMLSSNGVC
jgi:glutamate dehydrogenase